MLQEMQSQVERKRGLRSMIDKTMLYQFGRMFKRLHHPTNEQASKLGTTEKDYLITRNQFIAMTGASPAFFHAILQKMPNFPKVREIKKHRHFYLKSEVDNFLNNLSTYH